MLELREYQVDALNAVRQKFASGLKRIVLTMPTGSGKSLTAAHISKLAIAKGNPVAFICDRITLVHQAYEYFSACGLDVGIMQGENMRNLGAGLLVGSIQTIARRGLPPHVWMLIVDEAHGCAGSSQYLELFRRKSALPIIGLTATPFSKGMAKHHDCLGGKLFEDIVCGATIKGLIDTGFLVDCEVYGPSEPDLTGVKITAGDYNETQLGEAVDKPALVGDIILHWHKLAGRKQTVVFATNIAHSKHIVEEFNKAGVPAEHLDAYTSQEDRRDIFRRIRERKTLVVSNVDVLTCGWDMPQVEVMVCARPTRSLIKWIQRAGRILRPFEGKRTALILDHSGTCKRLGFPTDDLPLEFDDGKPRKSSGTNGRDDPLPKECPSCKYVKPAKVHKCPKCGFAPQKRSEVEVQDGVLRKMSRGAKIATADRNQVYAELRGFARDRGMKDGWAWYACRNLFGSAPRGKPEPVTPSDETLRLIKHLQIKRANARAAA